MPMAKSRRHDWIYFVGGRMKFKMMSRRKRLLLINKIGFKRKGHAARKFNMFTNSELLGLYYRKFGKHFGQ